MAPATIKTTITLDGYALQERFERTSTRTTYRVAAPEISAAFEDSRYAGHAKPAC